MNNNIPGFTNQHKLEIIARWVEELPDNINAVEVGSYCGRSAYTISKKLKKNSRLTCIDDFRLPVNKDAYNFVNIPVGYIGKNSKENLLKYLEGCDNVEVLVGKGTDYIINNVGFVFIDDSHFNPDFKDNLQHWWKQLSVGGILCGDDFYEYSFDNKKLDVIKEVLKLANENNVKVEIEQHLWKIKKLKKSVTKVLDFTSNIDYVDQNPSYMDELYDINPEFFEKWFVWIKTNLHKILKMYNVPEGDIIQAGTWNGIVYDEFKKIFGTDRCKGFDIVKYINDNSIIYGDFRKTSLDYNGKCALFYNGLGAWDKNKNSKEAGLEFAKKNLVPGGLYLDVIHHDNSILLDIPELKYCNTYDNKLIILRKIDDRL